MSTVVVQRSSAVSVTPLVTAVDAVVGSSKSIVTEVERAGDVDVIEVAIGPPGPQGPPGPAGGTTITRIGAIALGGHRMVRMNSAGLLEYADCSDQTHGDDTLGMTTSASVQGAEAYVQPSGPIEFNGWAWTPGEPVFLGQNGLVTQTPPDDGFVQTIGYAETATSIFLRIDSPFYF